MFVRSVRDFLLLRRIGSVRTKTLVVILPLLIAIVAAASAEAFILSRQIVRDQTHSRMEQQLRSIMGEVEKRLTAHRKVTEALARTVEAEGRRFSLQDYRLLTRNMLDASSDTFGMGVFFEPYKRNPQLQYYSAYSYRDKDGAKASTEEYNDPAYNYPSQSWYTMVGQKGENGSVLSPPYHDKTTGVTMVTATVPFFDTNQQFLGVATGDIDLSTIQRMIAETKVGKTGWVFLTDAQGTYIAGPDKEKIMNAKVTEEKNPSLAKLGGQILRDKQGNGMFKDERGLNDAFFAGVPSTPWILTIVIPDKELGQPLAALTRNMALIGLIGIVIVAAVIYLYSGYIAGNMKKINILSRYMADGDFTHEIEIRSGDEFGTISKNFNDATALIRGMLQKVVESTLHVSSTSHELSAAAQETNGASRSIASSIREVADGTGTQMIGAEEAASALEEMSAGIQRIAESSSFAASSSAEAAERANGGNRMVQQAVTQMEVINASVENTSGVIARLDTRSKEIGMIINSIADISSQTNLLALNASIEAARAGEHGRGFAVVAGEVKRLAQQAQRSAEEIEELIHMIQSDVVEAVRVMGEGAEEVRKGSGIVGEAGQAFAVIKNKVDEIAGQLQEISAASQQISAGSEEVTASVNELAHIAKDASVSAQHVAASSDEQMVSMEQVSASAIAMNEMVQELQEQLAKFKV